MYLDSFPRVLWINLNKSIKRRIYMENILMEYNINAIRIDAIDGTNRINPNLDNICIANSDYSSVENACTCSHLLAMKYFVENMEDDKVVIFEDDVSFDFLKYIPYNWSDFEKHLPNDYEIIQLAITHEKNKIYNYLVKFDMDLSYYCSVAYLITKSCATKILNQYYSEEHNKFDLSQKIHVTADSIITKTCQTYCIPIFTYQTTDSIIHPRHLYNHRISKAKQLEMWKKTHYHLNTLDLDEYFTKFGQKEIEN